MRLSWLTRRREEADRQAWLARVQDFHDPALRRRLVAVVGRALEANDAEVDSDEKGVLTSFWWDWKSEADVAAQRYVMPNQTTSHEISVELDDDADNGPWIFTDSGWPDGQVRFMPGAEFSSPNQFLYWFEQAGGVR
jgi:hypothetical protein